MRKKLLLIFILVLALGLVSASAFAKTNSAPKPDPIKDESLVWDLSNALVVDLGKTAAIKEGTLTTGYIIEADAVTTNASLVSRGTFRITLSAFSPNQDMPGQKAGRWYVRGEWTITDPDVAAQAGNARHNPGVIKGSLSAELPYNPTVARSSFGSNARSVRNSSKPVPVAQTLEADVQISMSPAAGRWVQAQGMFTGSNLFEGQLVMDARLWPALSEGGSK